MRVLRLFGCFIIFVKRKEVESVAVIYVALIVKGKRDFSQVPEIIKPQVREMLADLELEDLIVE